MIKGTNHQVIEVSETDNIYYERAFLVLRPEFADIEREILEKEARRMLMDMDTISTAKPRIMLKKRLLSAFICSAVGSLITVIIYSVI